MLRRWLCFFCALALLLLLAGCGGADAPALVVNGVPVSRGVFRYYEHDALMHTAQYGLEPNDETGAAQIAEAQCRRLVALDQYLKQHKITVRADLKSEVATRTEGEWALFAAHYRALGMTKPDLTRINTADAQKKQLVQHFYGAGGKHEMTEDALKKSFVKRYVGFKAFEGALTTQTADGETVPLDADAQAALREQFRQMANRANSGTDLDALYAEYSETLGLIVTSPLAVSLMKDGDPMYDDSFFKQVAALDPGSTGVIQTADSLYLLQRAAIGENDEAFAAYRDEVLYHEKLPAVEAFVAKRGEQTTLA